MPFFQSPDENAHADYAFTLFTTRSALPRSGRNAASDVHPAVKYLEDASGFRNMRHNPDGRVPSGYGNSRFFETVDAGAPAVRRDFLDHNGGRIPYVATSYSYLYYGLDAVAIQIGAWLSNDSASSEFLAARLFGLVLLLCSLLFSYGTLREMRFGVAASLVVVATIGLFPLTSWVSAYVQPDNLSFTAVALTFYIAYRLRRDPDQLRGAGLMGLALALLVLTKSQYFVAVALPVLADRTLRFSSRSRSLRQWCAYVVLIGVPALLGGLSTRVATNGADHQVAAFINASGSPLATAAGHGTRELLEYLTKSLISALSSFYYDGFTFYGFWGEFGWSRTQITFGSAALTASVFSLLAAASILVGSLVALCLLVRTAPRIVLLARRKGFLIAARFAASDVILNSYILFLTIMLAINISTSGEMANEGRYWLPMILPTFLLAIRYAPRALPRPLRWPFRSVLGGGALAYSVVAALAALVALDSRFYFPAANELTGEGWAMVRHLGPYRIQSFSDYGAHVLRANSVVSVDGVAIDSRSDSRARFVDVLIDGRRWVRAHLGLIEPQVVRSTHDDALLHTGFVASVDLRGLSDGTHEMRLAIGERSRRKAYLSYFRVKFTIDSARREFSSARYGQIESAWRGRPSER